MPFPYIWGSTLGGSYPGTDLDADFDYALQYVNNLSSVAGTNTITANADVPPAAYAAGQMYGLVPAGPNTGPVTVNISALGPVNAFYNGGACAGGELQANVPVLLYYDGTQLNIIAISKAPVLRSYLSGLTLSTAGGSGTMTIAAGQATDSTNAQTMTLAASIGKTTSAWAVGSGNGGLDTGAIANSTWYKFYEIKRTDTGVVDVIFTTAALATGPAMPTNYSLFRYIGSGKTDGSAHWTAFVQYGDYFEWVVPTLDINQANPGTNAVSAPLNVPLGVQVMTRCAHTSINTAATGGGYYYASDLAITDEVPSATFSQITNEILTASGSIQSMTEVLDIMSNTSSQIRYRLSASTASVTINIVTQGWTDRRGRDL